MSRSQTISLSYFGDLSGIIKGPLSVSNVLMTIDFRLSLVYSSLNFILFLPIGTNLIHGS